MRCSMSLPLASPIRLNADAAYHVSPPKMSPNTWGTATWGFSFRSSRGHLRAIYPVCGGLSTIGRLLSLRLQFQTPVKGREFDIRFDDVIVAFH